jgi:hypothetical protein
MAKEERWLPSAASIETSRNEWREYLLSKDAEIFRSPDCAGYWMYGVEHDPKRGWLVYEFGEDESEDFVNKDHSAAINRFKKGMSPTGMYHVIDEFFANMSFNNGVQKWGVQWRENPHHDLSEVDLVLQYTLFGKIKYG